MTVCSFKLCCLISTSFRLLVLQGVTNGIYGSRKASLLHHEDFMCKDEKRVDRMIKASGGKKKQQLEARWLYEWVGG